MAEEQTRPAAQPQQAPSSGKSAGKKSTGAGGLAPVQGSYEKPGPDAEIPGTREHLGSDRPYEGGEPEVADRS